MFAQLAVPFDRLENRLRSYKRLDRIKVDGRREYNDAFTGGGNEIA